MALAVNGTTIKNQSSTPDNITLNADGSTTLTTAISDKIQTDEITDKAGTGGAKLEYVGYDDDLSSWTSNTLVSGAIVERGSNVNGEYIKFADGTALLSSIALSGTDTWVLFGNIYRDVTPLAWTYPLALVATPYVSPANSSNSRAMPNVHSVGSTSASVAFLSGESGLGIVSAKMTAIGRWK